MSIAMKLANSVKFALPKITAPAARSWRTTVASCLARADSRAREPAVVCWPSAVAMLSLTRIGIPASGQRFDGFCPSASAAMASASGLTSRTELRLGPARS